MKKVIVIGELNVDIILNGIKGFPEVGKEILADQMIVTLGSSSAIFASNLSSLGIQVDFIGKIGRDNFASLVLSSLENKKVGTSHIIRSDSFLTGATIVLNYEQDRANITYPGAMADLQLADIDFDFLSTGSHLHFSSFFLQPGIRNDLVKVFQKAKSMGLTTSLDPQWDPDETWDFPTEELLPWLDLFLPNDAEFTRITKTTTIEDGLSKLKSFPTKIIIKKGTDGSYGWDGNRMIHQPAFLNETVVDCIGAGDSFNAGFISKFVEGESFEECLRYGAKMGALNTTAAGGTGAFESIKNIEKILLEKFKV